ncbi:MULTISPECIES: hypothetical protein [unclassified Vibrio]|uniref:Uncharacterized protein n=1 Tax=Vibrio sp. HB236076 TaxID=3232307 RepID=A0AB39HKU1_9VIBR|nr:hypothetical protein [Vibrio sp. HB161653]MDP5252768.1 hypothetical protein [Vibrio sp. HB161653]
MDMNEFINLFWQPTILVGALTYLAKKTIEHLFKVTEKNYETSAKAVSEKELSLFKTELGRATQKFNVKTSGVYERQALAFTELYSYVSDLDFYMNVVMNQGALGDENEKKFKSVYFELRTFWRRNRLLIPEDIDTLISALVNDAFWGVEKYNSGERRFISGDFDGGTSQKNEALELTKSIPQILNLLTIEFRRHIGVTE